MRKAVSVAFRDAFPTGLTTPQCMTSVPPLSLPMSTICRTASSTASMVLLSQSAREKRKRRNMYAQDFVLHFGRWSSIPKASDPALDKRVAARAATTHAEVCMLVLQEEGKA